MTTFTESPESPLGRALGQRSNGDIDAAIETLLSAAGESLADANLAVTLGKMLAETGQYERAEPWFHHAMKLAPDDVVVRMGYGAFLGEVGRIEEARVLLEGVRPEVRAMLTSAAAEGRPALVGLEGFIACTELNLARAAFEAGDSAFARELVGPWLADANHWPPAHAVLADIVDRDGLDPTQVAEDGLASGQVSPYMVCHLLELIVDAEVCDFGAFERVVARADACFAFDWKGAEPELTAVVARARQLFGHAVMRGVVEPAMHPHLAMLAAQPEAATSGLEAVGANDAGDEDADIDEDDADEGDEDVDAIDEDNTLEVFAREFVRHWGVIRERIAAGEDVALDRVDAFASDDPDRQLSLARDHYSIERAEAFARLSIEEAVELIGPWAEAASELMDDGCVETIRSLVAAEHVLVVYGKWACPVTNASAVNVWDATCGGVGSGGSFWIRKTTGEPFADDEGSTFVRWIEEEFTSDVSDGMDDDGTVSVALEDAFVIAGDASCVERDEDESEEDEEGEDEDDDESEEGEDQSEEAEPDSDFHGVVRLAGWNDTECGIHIVLGHRSGVFCFQTGDADYPAVPTAVAESLAVLFERGIAGLAPRRACRPMPIDRNWLVEGAGTSQVVRFDVIAPDQWPLVNAAMAVFEVHAVIVAAVSEPTSPFAVLIASSPDHFVAVEACWSDDGFLYRRKGDSGEADLSFEAWSKQATTDLASLVPELDRLMPFVLHPLAAWGLLEPVRALQSDQAALCRREWLEFTDRAIATHAPATLLPPFADVDEDEEAEEPDADDDDDDDDDKEDDVDRAIAELGPWNADDPNEWTVRERLAGLAGFGASLTGDNLALLAAREALTQTPLANGSIMLGEAPPADVVMAFIALGYKFGWVTPRVRWMRWHDTPEALKFDDPACTAQASLDDLIRLVTTIIVRDRFVGNSLHYAIEGGFVHHIVARAAALLVELDAGVFHTSTLFGDAPRS